MGADEGRGGLNRRARLVMNGTHLSFGALVNWPFDRRRYFGAGGGFTALWRLPATTGLRSFEPEVGLSVTARRCRAESSWSGRVGVFMGAVYATACGVSTHHPQSVAVRWGCRCR